MNPLLVGAGLVGIGLSLRWNWWRPILDGIPILMYHKVGEPPPGSKLKKLWVSPKMFRQQMSYLSRNGFEPITFKDIYDHWDQSSSLPPQPVLLTFDDGYANNYQEAFPILRDFGFRATLFVVVGMVGNENRWHDPGIEVRLPMISWEEVKELSKAGWEIGSHTLTHPKLPSLDFHRRQEEIEKSREQLREILKEVPQTFAYPYGAGEDDPQIREQVERSGYRLAVGVHSGKWALNQIKANPFNLPRIFVRGDENILDFHLQMTRGKSRI